MEERKLTREQKKAVYRKAILKAAKAEFVRKGYKEASVAAIMDEAHLGVGTFYNYFASKEEILMELLTHLLQEVAEELADMKRDGVSAGERLKEGCHRMARLLDENQYVLALFLSVGGHIGHGNPKEAVFGKRTGRSEPKAAQVAGRMASRAPQVKDLFLKIIGEGQAEGSIRSDVPAPMVAEMLHATYQSAAFSHAGIPFRENFEAKFRLLIEGIRTK